MAGIRESVNAELKRAMQAGDGRRRDTLRLLLAALKQEEVDSRQALTDEAEAAVLLKQAKQRRESMEQYGRGGREDLVAAESAELAVIEEFLPKMLSAEQISAMARAIITELGITDARGMGQVMNRLMPQVKGQADGKEVNRIVRALLQP